MVLHGWQIALKKSRPVHIDQQRDLAWIAIEGSYIRISWANEFQLWCEHGWFSLRQSHLCMDAAAQATQLQLCLSNHAYACIAKAGW